MQNLIALAISLAAIHFFSKPIRKYAAIFYATALIFSAGALAYPAFPISSIINDGYLGLSLWIIVMFVGIRNPFKALSKKIRLVRTQLSVAAFIFTFAHFIHDFMLSLELSIATGIVSLVIMAPLFATSFEIVRKRFKCSTWKKFHRFAYGAYVLMFMHVILVTGNTVKLLYYSAALSLYLFFKFRRARAATRTLIYPLLLLIIFNLISSPLINPFKTEKATSQIAPVASSSSENLYRDGTYIGTADGYGPDLTVEVAIENNEISKIDIVSHNERGESFYMPAFEAIPAKIIDSQSISVDAVSGSTYSSYGIMNAVNDALSDAIESGSIKEIDTPEHSEEEERGTGKGKGNGEGLHKGNHE